MATASTQDCDLHVPPRTWRRFRDEMIAARPHAGDEVIGFFFCTRHRVTSSRFRLLPKVWVVPSSDCYTRQSAGGLELDQHLHAYLVQEYLLKGLDVVHVHTHPGHSRPFFSSIDDRGEAAYARFLQQLKGTPFFGSGVFDESLEQSRFRAWFGATTAATRDMGFSRELFGQALQWSDDEPTNDYLDPVFDRQRLFGEEAQQRLGQLRIGLVGCGGIGAVFAEQLARIGVRQWVLVDSDRVDVTNLNRMPFATASTARGQWRKVRYVRSMIQRARGERADVKALSLDVQHPEARRALAECDLIVVATDNHSSRLEAQDIALRFVRPLLCLGTRIQADGMRPPRPLARVTLPPYDGGWCLVCGGVISTHEVAVENATPDIRAILSEAGYISGVAAPAVYWINTLCASMAASVVHQAAAGLLNLDHGLDWVLDARSHEWLSVDHDEEPSCFHCSTEGVYASGDAAEPAVPFVLEELKLTEV